MYAYLTLKRVEHRLAPPILNMAADGRAFRVSCDCGWRSPWCSTSIHAIASGEQHLQLVGAGPEEDGRQAADA